MKKVKILFCLSIVFLSFLFINACKTSDIKHKVTFMQDNEIVASIDVSEGEKIYPAFAEKADHHFDGWYFGESLFSFDTPITSDLTLTAHFTPTPPPSQTIEKHTITFHDKDGKTLSEEEVYHGSDLNIDNIKIDNLPFYEKLIGWKDSEGKTVNFSNITQDLDVYPLTEINATDESYFTFTANENSDGYIIGAAENAVFPEKLVFPSTHNDLPVVGIADDAFNGYSSTEGIDNIISIYIPSTIKSTGYRNFLMLESLEEVVLAEGVEDLGYMAFSTCTSLRIINFPDSLRSISYLMMYGISLPHIDFGNNPYFTERDNAIYSADGKTLYYVDCTLTDFTIPKDVEKINGCVFNRHDELVSVTIDAELDELPNSCFNGCTNLESIQIYGIIKKIPDVIMSDLATGEDIEDSEYWVSEVGEDFDGYIIFGDTGESPFKDCNSLTSIVFPSGLEYIGAGAFQGLTNLQSISIPNTVTYIAPSAFDVENAFSHPLTEILITGESALNADKYYVDGNVCLIEKGTGPNGGDKVLSFAAGNQSVKDYTIPQGVTGFSYRCFAYSLIENLTIPEGVEYIYAQAFCDMSNLESVKFPSTLKEIKSSAFHDKECGNYMVYGNTNVQTNFSAFGIINNDKGKLKEVDLSKCENLTKIDAYSFYSQSISTVKLPANVTYIADSAFVLCSEITEFSILGDSSSAIYIDSENGLVYNGDKSKLLLHFNPTDKDIKEIKIDDNVKEISDYCFCNNLDTLTRIELPEQLEKIGLDAFYGNYSEETLSIVFTSENPPYFPLETFNPRKKENLKIYVPETALKEYLYATSGCEITACIDSEKDEGTLAKTYIFNANNGVDENITVKTAILDEAPVPSPVYPDYFQGWWTKNGKENDDDWGTLITFPYIYNENDFENPSDTVNLYARWGEEKFADGSCMDLAIDIVFLPQVYSVGNQTMWFKFTNYTDHNVWMGDYTLMWNNDEGITIAEIRIYFYFFGTLMEATGFSLAPGETTYFQITFRDIENNDGNIILMIVDMDYYNEWLEYEERKNQSDIL